MAGYSATPLQQKLGIKAGMTLGIIDPPDGFARSLGPLSSDVAVHYDVAGSDIFILFGRWADELEESFHDAAALLPPDGAIWVAWPKRSSGVETDITEDTPAIYSCRRGWWTTRFAPSMTSGPVFASSFARRTARPGRSDL